MDMDGCCTTECHIEARLQDFSPAPGYCLRSCWKEAGPRLAYCYRRCLCHLHTIVDSAQPELVDSLYTKPADSQCSMARDSAFGIGQQQEVAMSFDIARRREAGSTGWYSGYSMGSNCSTLLL